MWRSSQALPDWRPNPFQFPLIANGEGFAMVSRSGGNPDRVGPAFEVLQWSRSQGKYPKDKGTRATRD